MLYCDTAIIKVKTGSSRSFTKSILNLKLKLKKTVVYHKSGGDVFFEGCVLQTNLNHLQIQNNTLSAGMAMCGKRGNNLLIAAPIGTYVYIAETGKILNILNKKRPVLIVAAQKSNTNYCTQTQNPLRLFLQYHILAHLSFFGLHNSGHFYLQRKVLGLLLGTYDTIVNNSNVPVVSRCLEGKFFSVCIPTCFSRAGIFYNTYYLHHSTVPRIILYTVDICTHNAIITAGLLGSFLDALQFRKRTTFKGIGRKIVLVLFTFKDVKRHFLVEEKIKSVVTMLGYRLFFLKTTYNIVGWHRDICKKCLLLLSKKIM
jgi:hypothetical protein